ncbi:hypothetical protein CK203_035640 [Vitis vinifera]|uniref:Retrotransposon gag domain-containing protein n=1 Tax=Vitis vinifera TaxID=29760 RepID=A0A438ICJ0_VITVI|nr:hypothetical protein CK203_035640 [Vitis vinifera]
MAVRNFEHHAKPLEAAKGFHTPCQILHGHALRALDSMNKSGLSMTLTTLGLNLRALDASSGSQESNASNRVRFGAEMRKIWPSEATAPGYAKISHSTSQTTSEDVFPEDERLNFRFLGVSSNLCMPYWIRDQEGRLVRIENPQDTELDICVNIMDPPPEDQNSQQGQGVVIRPHIVPLLPNFHGMESENPYAHIKEFEEDQWVEETNLKLFCKENEKFHECWERYMEAINACPHHGFDTWLLVSYFYDGMSSSMKQILETMCGGDFMSKNPEEAMDFLSYVSEVSRGWDEPNSREKGKFPSQPTQNPKGGMYV